MSKLWQATPASAMCFRTATRVCAVHARPRTGARDERARARQPVCPLPCDWQSNPEAARPFLAPARFNESVITVDPSHHCGGARVPGAYLPVWSATPWWKTSRAHGAPAGGSHSTPNSVCPRSFWNSNVLCIALYALFLLRTRCCSARAILYRSNGELTPFKRRIYSYYLLKQNCWGAQAERSRHPVRQLQDATRQRWGALLCARAPPQHEQRHAMRAHVTNGNGSCALIMLGIVRAPRP